MDHDARRQQTVRIGRHNDASFLTSQPDDRAHLPVIHMHPVPVVRFAGTEIPIVDADDLRRSGYIERDLGAFAEYECTVLVIGSHREQLMIAFRCRQPQLFLVEAETHRRSCRLHLRGIL